MVLVRERDDRLAMSHVKAVWHRNQAAVRLMRERADGAFDLSIIVNLELFRSRVSTVNSTALSSD